MADNKTLVKTTCQLCLAACGMLVHLEDGRPVRIEGDPDHPISRGALCINGQAALEYLASPYRLHYPLKRNGARGEGRWQTVSWDEALTATAHGLHQVRKDYSAASVAFMQGGAKGYSDVYLSRLANAFGTPNIASMSYLCFHAKLRGMLATYGYMSHADINHPPRTIIAWGANLTATAPPEGARILEAKERGARLIVIDPAKTVLAAKADVWIRPRPSSDLALALALLNVIINEGLYDAAFVRHRAVGFEELQTHVQAYTPEMAADICWVSADQIAELGREYASGRPAVIYCGNGEENNVNNYQFNRAAAILRAVTGNLDIPGGEIDWEPPALQPRGSAEFDLRHLIPPEERSKRLGIEENVLPDYFSALPPKVFKAMLTSHPYPIRAAFIQGGSFLHTHTNVQEVRKALESLDFLAVSDFFMTPTAELADVVFPASTFLELDGVALGEAEPLASPVRKVAQLGECRSDLAIVSALAAKLGLGQHFADEESAVLDFLLEPSGLNFADFCKAGVIEGSKLYGAYKDYPFPTPSGKVELYSQRLEEWGFDPLPVYHEPPESPYSAPDLANEFPLVLTNSKIPGYVHSGGRQIPSLRQAHPEPLVTINRETAERQGIAAGDWVCISTKRGHIEQKAALSDDIDPRVIVAEHGWYFPDKNENLHGWDEANLNVLTSNDPPYARELGSVTLRGILCSIERADQTSASSTR
jgi:anaerobic selenocysteine-containing dehydrogenase